MTEPQAPSMAEWLPAIATGACSYRIEKDHIQIIDAPTSVAVPRFIQAASPIPPERRMGWRKWFGTTGPVKKDIAFAYPDTIIQYLGRQCVLLSADSRQGLDAERMRVEQEYLDEPGWRLRVLRYDQEYILDRFIGELTPDQLIGFGGERR